MANHKSAEKRIRQTASRSAVNKSRTSRIRTFIKNVETAIASGDYNHARAELQKAQPEIMRGVTKGLIKLNAAARKMSRLSSRVKALNASKA